MRSNYTSFDVGIKRGMGQCFRERRVGKGRVKKTDGSLFSWGSLSNPRNTEKREY